MHQTFRRPHSLLEQYDAPSEIPNSPKAMTESNLYKKYAGKSKQ
jgi:hypothetical protein